MERQREKERNGKKGRKKQKERKRKRGVRKKERRRGEKKETEREKEGRREGGTEEKERQGRRREGRKGSNTCPYLFEVHKPVFGIDSSVSCFILCHSSLVWLFEGIIWYLNPKDSGTFKERTKVLTECFCLFIS